MGGITAKRARSLYADSQTSDPKEVAELAKWLKDPMPTEIYFENSRRTRNGQVLLKPMFQSTIAKLARQKWAGLRSCCHMS